MHSIVTNLMSQVLTELTDDRESIFKLDRMPSLSYGNGEILCRDCIFNTKQTTYMYTLLQVLPLRCYSISCNKLVPYRLTEFGLDKELSYFEDIVDFDINNTDYETKFRFICILESILFYRPEYVITSTVRFLKLYYPDAPLELII